MSLISRKRRLKKELGLFGVYAIATGTTLSAGFFLLPGLAAEQAGPAIVLAYLLAAVPLVPAMFSIAELATAMPRAGGVYYFLDRSLGPMVGTIGGLGTWIALMLKVAFALVGMGAYLGVFLPTLPIVPVGAALAVVMGGINILGAKGSGRLQLGLVVGLLALLGGFVVGGLGRIHPGSFAGFFDAGVPSILSTAGLVYISYVGVTNVASLSEEIQDPERNIPRGIFLALGSAMVIYVLGMMVMVGVVPMQRLAGDLRPVATAAGALFGPWGKRLLAVAALLAFTSVANAGILSSSRYPLALSRDHLLPRALRRLTPSQTPARSIVLTVAIILAVLLVLDPTRIAKLASAFQLLMFALVCMAVVVMRESRIESYDPGYHSPLYPWMQIIGIVTPLFLIAEMGALAVVSILVFVGTGMGWFLYYGRERVGRRGAFFHVLTRLARRGPDPGIDRELREILKEKGLREEDPFDEMVAAAALLDLEEGLDFPLLAARAAALLEDRLPATARELTQGFLDGTRIGATPVSRGIALPHLRLFGIDRSELVLARSREGFQLEVTDVHGEHSPEEPVHAVFFLVSPEEDPRLHLRLLAQIAERVDDEGFLESWMEARNEQELKEILLREERFLSLRLRLGTPGDELIGRTLRDLDLPEGVLVALVRRAGESYVPRGGTVLEAGDRLTIIGTPEAIRRLGRRYDQG